MAYTPIKIPPGINTEIPSLTSEPAWRSCDKVRFKNGQPEKLGGWQQTAAGLNPLTGIARSIHTWRTNAGVLITAIGTHEKLHLFADNAVTDITPLRTTGVALGTDPFDTTSGNPIVTVTHTTHGATEGDYVTFYGAVCATLDDTEVNANHKITYIDANTYTITVTTNASGTDPLDGGASVTADYEISVGIPTNAAAYGWGAGPWNRELWNRERTVGIALNLRYWSLDHFGEILVACHEASRIYEWTYAGNFADRATLISNSPTYSDFILVTSPDRHLVAFATETTGTQDKMLIAWADRETLNTWTPNAENTAGDYPISGGSRLVTARRTQNSTLIWTDSNMLSMQFIGAPFTFGFTEIGANCGAVSPSCVVSKDTSIFWMAETNFFMYDGVVKILPCTVHRDIYKNIKHSQISKVVGGLIREFDEVIWFYPSSNSTENNKYVIYNYVQNIWYNGTIDRTAWEDSEMKDYPVGINSTGTIFNHELTVNDNGAALTPYIESSNFDVAEGDKAYLITSLVPDMSINAGSVDYILKTRRYPHSTQVTDTTKTVSATTEDINVRVRSKLLALRIESNAIGDDWRMGTPRIDIRPDGGRA